MKASGIGWAALAAAATLGTACVAMHKSSAGFHLPDGDPRTGRQVFADMRCHACHQVPGEEFPPPVADPPVNVALGGVVPYPRADGELMTAIVDPSHRIVTRDLRHRVRDERLSRMGDLRDHMTVAEMVDLVAYLHSLYHVQPPTPLAHAVAP
jgi:sulfur-oxidizing protein SoxX